MAKKNQIIFIRGGEVFHNKDDFYSYLKNREYKPHEVKKSWRDWVAWALSSDFEVFEPVMPNKQWADYIAWSIWFEKIYPYLGNGKIILIGQSLGATFLMKYLSENVFPKNISQLHFVSPAFNDNGLKDEILGDFKPDAIKLSQINSLSEKIFLYASENDPLVPFDNTKLYTKHMHFTDFFVFQDRGHFDQPAFPELLETIYANL